jgi:hypothetical protein
VASESMQPAPLPSEQGAVTAPPEDRPLKEARADHWLAWIIGLAAIAVPVVVLLCTDSIPKDKISWGDVDISMQRGDFLVPAMLLCVETIRRWWRDVECRRFLKFIRHIATALCIAAIVVCLIATTTAATLAQLSPASGRSLTTITVGCLVISVSFGTLAVASATGKVGARWT